MMLVDIYGAILRPKAEGEYVVVISVFPLEDAPNGFRHLHRAATAACIEDAREMRRNMALAVREEVERLGHEVRIVHIR